MKEIYIKYYYGHRFNKTWHFFSLLEFRYLKASGSSWILLTSLNFGGGHYHSSSLQHLKIKMLSTPSPPFPSFQLATMIPTGNITVLFLTPREVMMAWYHWTSSLAQSIFRATWWRGKCFTSCARWEWEGPALRLNVSVMHKGLFLFCSKC